MNNSLFDPVRRALWATWVDFWALVERHGGLVAFYAVLYLTMAGIVRLVAPEVFDLAGSGSVSERGLSIGILLSPLSLVIFITWREVRRRGN